MYKHSMVVPYSSQEIIWGDNMKKKIIACTLIVGLVVFVFYTYPTEKRILGNIHYEFTNTVSDKIVTTKIITSEYKPSSHKVNLNKTLLKDDNSRIYLNKIYLDDINRVVINIRCASRWHYLKGNCLSIYSISKSGTSYEIGGAPINFKLTDENNNTLPYLQSGRDPGGIISIILSKDDFLNCKSINLELKGFNLITYNRLYII